MTRSNEPPVPVIFKRDREGVFAAFPTLPGNTDPVTMLCYSHAEHHSHTHMQYVANASSAGPGEYADLKRELEGPPHHYRLAVRRAMLRSDLEARRVALRWQG